MSESALFPPIYQRWLSEKLAGQVRESKATCDRCAMVKPEGLTRDQGPFQDNLKCCTYFPFLPNLSVGALLEQNSSAFRLRFEQAKAQGLLLPVGLYPTPERQRLMEERRDEFGQRADMLCPFFDARTSGCSIWFHRPAVCTTYFCKSDYDEVGFEFWADVEDDLNHFEWVMATELFGRLGLAEEEMQACRDLMSTRPGLERDQLVEKSWGVWRGREEEFYLQAWNESHKISAHEVDEMMGEESLELEETLRARVFMMKST